MVRKLVGSRIVVDTSFVRQFLIFGARSSLRRRWLAGTPRSLVRVSADFDTRLMSYLLPNNNNVLTVVFNSMLKYDPMATVPLHPVR